MSTKNLYEWTKKKLTKRWTKGKEESHFEIGMREKTKAHSSDLTPIASRERKTPKINPSKPRCHHLEVQGPPSPSSPRQRTDVCLVPYKLLMGPNHLTEDK